MYKYNLYYDGGWLKEESGFDTEDEAREEAESEIESRIEYWEAEGTEYDRDLFSAEVDED